MYRVSGELRLCFICTLTKSMVSHRIVSLFSFPKFVNWYQSSVYYGSEYQSLYWIPLLILRLFIEDKWIFDCGLIISSFDISTRYL